MARKKDLVNSDPAADLQAQINADFNTVIRKAHKSLSTKTHSPVYTGFFASSWKVQTTGVKPRDDIRNFRPWSNIKKNIAAMEANANTIIAPIIVSFFVGHVILKVSCFTS